MDLLGLNAGHRYDCYLQYFLAYLMNSYSHQGTNYLLVTILSSKLNSSGTPLGPLWTPPRIQFDCFLQYLLLLDGMHQGPVRTPHRVPQGLLREA